MYPNLFGIENASYVLMMLVGIVASFLIAFFYFKKKQISKNGVIDMLICACFAVASGIIFSTLFENLYEVIAYGTNYSWTWGMTFYGGLIGGAAGFVITYFIMRKNVNFNILDVVKIAPISITAAHAFGRIGCFLAGCCHGIETNSWIGIDFPYDNLGKVVPTQLIESIFLFALCGILFFLLKKYDFKYTFVVYMVTYGVFRFVIEFYRGDDRGVAFVLSPSQVLSIIFIIGSIPLFFFLKKAYRSYEEK